VAVASWQTCQSLAAYASTTGRVDREKEGEVADEQPGNEAVNSEVRQRLIRSQTSTIEGVVQLKYQRRYWACLHLTKPNGFVERKRLCSGDSDTTAHHDLERGGVA